MMKIFSDKSVLHYGEQYVPILIPFWGNYQEDPALPYSCAYNRYHKVGLHIFQFTPLNIADLAIFPINFDPPYFVAQGLLDYYTNLTNEFIDRTAEMGVQPVIFSRSDTSDQLHLHTCTTFRTSLYASKKQNKEFSMPAWTGDFVRRHLGGRMSYRRKPNKPVVGFCGYSLPLFTTPHGKIKHFLATINRNVTNRPFSGNRLRAWCLTNLHNSPKVTPNVVIRDKFYGGAVTHLPEVKVNKIQIQAVFKEYLENMIQSDYILCARGQGNFSYRFFETLCCGRIPILIDTDCVLPFENVLDWDQYCIRISEKEIPEIAEIVNNFHSALSEMKFQTMQEECRQLWVERLSPEGFFSHFHEHFLEN